MMQAAQSIQHDLESILKSVANAPIDPPQATEAANDDFALPEPENLEQSSALAQLLARAPGACARVPDHDAAPPGKETKAQWTGPISLLLEELSADRAAGSGPKRRHPPGERAEVQGVFFGCHLLYPGWWSRSGTTPILRQNFWGAGAKVQKVLNIRRWLNSGFEQWGPSWNISDPVETAELRFEDLVMCGQIGQNDEANSLPVIISAGRTVSLRTDMERDLAIEATLTGRLYHRDDDVQHLDATIQRGLSRMFAAGQYAPYYIIVDDGDDAGIERVPAAKRQVEIYSAYLWHCLVASEDEPNAKNGTVPIDNTLFTWEHTNLLDPDVVRFNFESLWFKKRRLESRLGCNLLVLQHSYAIDEFIRESSRVVEPLIPSAVLSEALARARASRPDD